MTSKVVIIVVLCSFLIWFIVSAIIEGLKNSEYLKAVLENLEEDDLKFLSRYDYTFYIGNDRFVIWYRECEYSEREYLYVTNQETGRECIFIFHHSSDDESGVTWEEGAGRDPRNLTSLQDLRNIQEILEKVKSACNKKYKLEEENTLV